VIITNVSFYEGFGLFYPEYYINKPLDLNNVEINSKLMSVKMVRMVLDEGEPCNPGCPDVSGKPFRPHLFSQEDDGS